MNSSAANVFAALQLLSKAVHPIGVTEVAHALAIPLSSAHRALTTLEQAGFAARYQASPKWVPGPTGKQLAHSFFSRFRVRPLCLPYLRQLAFFTGETFALNVAVADDTVRIAAVSGTREVVSHRPLGERRRFPDGTASRVLLAFSGNVDRSGYAKLAAPSGDARRSLVEAEFDAIRRFRFALPLGQSLETATEASFILTLRDRPLAAITLEGPLHADGAADCLVVLRQILSVVAEIERDIAADDSDVFSPYDHLRIAQRP